MKPRFIQIVVFLSIFSIFLYIANLVVYEAIADIFLISNLRHLVFLGTALGVLSASLLVSIILGRRSYNIFTRLYYLTSAVWLGFFGYLFLVSVLYGLLLTLPLTPPGVVGKIFITCALLTSVYGIVHGKEIRIEEVEVALPNLPKIWAGKKAVWISDVHLGQIFGSSFARRIVEKINLLPRDIIFIGGDLYDGTIAPDIYELSAPLKELSAPLGVYFVTGNHEEFSSSEKFLSAVKSVGIEVLQDRMIDLDGLQLIGVDYHTTSKREQFKKILAGLAIDKNKTSILLKHEPKDLDVAAEAGVTLQISGHTHKAQIWPLHYIPNLIYKGFGYGLKSFKNMYVYTSSGVGTWGPPMRVGSNNEIVVFTFRVKM